jgi:hypothetical protein
MGGDEADRTGDLEHLVRAVIERRVAIVGPGEDAAEMRDRGSEGPPDAVIDRREAQVLADRHPKAA